MRQTYRRFIKKQLMDTKKLRQKILDLAIHGKLVPQDPNDEPASVLLERIKAEKERLIKEGKIKRSKKSGSSDTLHYENVPFEVPSSWVWCRLEDIVCELKYGTSEKSSSVGKIAVLRMGNISNVGTIDYSNLVYSSNDEDIEQYSLEKDDLLFNRTNSSEWVGKTAIYKEMHFLNESTDMVIENLEDIDTVVIDIHRFLPDIFWLYFPVYKKSGMLISHHFHKMSLKGLV